MVSTKDSGPVAWIMLHGLANAIEKSDLYIYNMVRAQHFMKEVLENMVHVFPCRHCRKSVGIFLNELREEQDFRKLIYKLHARVNNKLYAQDMADYGERFATNKWRCYQPEYSRVKYKDIESDAFLKATLMFISYMYKDWRTCERLRLKEFPTLLGELFEDLGTTYSEAWASTWHEVKSSVNGRSESHRMSAVNVLSLAVRGESLGV